MLQLDRFSTSLGNDRFDFIISCYESYQQSTILALDLEKPFDFDPKSPPSWLITYKTHNPTIVIFYNVDSADRKVSDFKVKQLKSQLSNHFASRNVNFLAMDIDLNTKKNVSMFLPTLALAFFDEIDVQMDFVDTEVPITPRYDDALLMDINPVIDW